MSTRKLHRRDLLKYSVAASAVWGMNLVASDQARAIDYSKPVPGSERLTAYHRGAQVLVRWNNVTAAAYRANPAQKFPYFHPLCGPSTGLPLTSESSLPYPHHRGLWLGCHPLNGGDYWSDGPLDGGQIRSIGLTLDKDATTPTSAAIHDRCRWVRPDAPSPLEDERKFTFSVPNKRVRILDVDLKLAAQVDISITKAKHSFFALRCAPDIAPMYGGVLMNSEGGVGAQGTYGKPAGWCGYHAKRRGHAAVEGIAIMNHPGNFGGDCPWFTRDYGNLSPSPFNFLDKPWTLSEGQTLELRYRVVLHAGDPQEARLDTLFEEWISG